MINGKSNIISAALTVALPLSLLFAEAAPAQNASSGSTAIGGIAWTELEKASLAGAPNKEGMLGIAVIQPGSPAVKHTHDENEVGYVMDGESILEVAGQATRRIKKGDSFLIPAGAIHRAKPTGKRPLKVIVHYIVEKGKPLANPTE